MRKYAPDIADIGLRPEDLALRQRLNRVPGAYLFAGNEDGAPYNARSTRLCNLLLLVAT